MRARVQSGHRQASRVNSRSQARRLVSTVHRPRQPRDGRFGRRQRINAGQGLHRSLGRLGSGNPQYEHYCVIIDDSAAEGSDRLDDRRSHLGRRQAAESADQVTEPFFAEEVAVDMTA